MLHLEYLRESSVSRLHVPQLPKQPYLLYKTKHHLHDKCGISIIWAYEAWHIHLSWTAQSRCCWMPRCAALQTNGKHSVWQKNGSILKSILWFYTKLKHCYICQITGKYSSLWPNSTNSEVLHYIYQLLYVWMSTIIKYKICCKC